VRKYCTRTRKAVDAILDHGGVSEVLLHTAIEHRLMHAETLAYMLHQLPLEKKISSLLQLEAIALGETVSFVINSPFKVFEKAMDVMAEFGFKLEKEAKEATRPKEHTKTEGDETDGEGKPHKASHAKKPKA